MMKSKGVVSILLGIGVLGMGVFASSSAKAGCGDTEQVTSNTSGQDALGWDSCSNPNHDAAVEYEAIFSGTFAENFVWFYSENGGTNSGFWGQLNVICNGQPMTGSWKGPFFSWSEGPLVSLSCQGLSQVDAVIWVD